MQTRWSLLLVAVCVAAIAAACGGTASKPHLNDAGGTTTAGSGGSTGNSICTDDTACSSGTFCIVGHCGTCNSVTRPLQCPSGTVCSASGACAQLTGSTTGGSGGSTGSTTGTSGGTACTHRSDCPNAQACLALPDAGGECGAPAPDAGCNSNDQCIKAYICQSHDCVAGCQNNLDCHGTAEPVCYPGNPGHCGACTQNSDCLSTENCDSSGRCVARASCTDSTSCNGLGCVNGTCAPCTSVNDCATGLQCDASSGHCVTGAGGCTSDSECQGQHNNSPAWYCSPIPDGGAPVCKLGCVADSLCGTPQTGCCNLANGQTCNTTTHTCQAGGTNTTGTTSTTVTTNGSSTTGTTGTSGSCTSSFDCTTCFNNNQQCDQTHCQCVGGTTTTSNTSNTSSTTAGFGTGGFGTGGFGTGGFGTGGFGSGGFGSGGFGSGGFGTGGSSGSGGSGQCGGQPAGGEAQPCNPDCSCNSGLTCQSFNGPMTDPSQCSAFCQFGVNCAICLP